MISKLTAVGKNLFLKALAGETIKFTSVQLGNGAEQTAESATMLSNPLLTIPITQIQIGNNYVTLTAVFNNSVVEDGFHITEVGFFAEDPDDPEKEILYALGNETESIADYVPKYTDRIFEMQFDALVFIGDAENVTANINSSLVYASKKEFDEHLSDTNNPHGVTAEDVGLGDVPNVPTNDQEPTYTTPDMLEDLESGETLSTAFGKIKLGISKLIAHLKNNDNPHDITAEKIKAAKEDHKHSTNDLTSGTLGIARGGTGGATAEKARENLGAASAKDPLKDISTAWKPLPLASGVTQGVIDDTPRQAPRYRKIGNHVTIKGFISTVVPASNTINLAAIPAGYRPTMPEYAQVFCAGTRTGRIGAHPNGGLHLEWIYNLTDGARFSGEIQWLQIKIDYDVD